AGVVSLWARAPTGRRHGGGMGGTGIGDRRQVHTCSHWHTHSHGVRASDMTPHRSVPYARGVSRPVSGCGTLAGGQRATTNPWTWIMRLPWRSRLVHVVLLGILLGGSPVGASATWEQVTTVEGMRVERRPLPGTGRCEVRVVASAPFPPHLIFETLWRHHDYPA